MVKKASDKIAQLDQIVQDEIKSNEAVASILTRSKDRYKVVKYQDVDIKIRPTVPKELRHRIEDSQDDPDMELREHAERRMYDIIAGMCIEEPFDDWKTWYVLDEENGDATEFIGKIYETAANTKAEIKRFRRE